MRALHEILFFLSSVFDAIFAYLIVKIVGYEKTGIRFKFAFIAVFAMAVLVFNQLNPANNSSIAAFFTPIDGATYKFFSRFFYGIVLLLLCKYTFRGRFIVKLFASVLYLIILEVGEIFTYGVVLLLFPDYLHQTDVSRDVIFLFGFFASYAYYATVLIIMRNFPTRSVWGMSIRQGIMLIAMPTICVVVIAILVSYLTNSRDSRYELYLIPSVFFILLLFFIVTFYKSMVESQEQARAKAVLSSQIEKFVEQYEALESADESLRSFRHDWNNHMMVIRSLSKGNDLEGLSCYIEEIQDITPTFLIKYTGNTTLDILLSGLKKKADQNAIDLSISAKIPSDLNIRVADLCVLISNALDNAFEACVKINTASRWIRVNFSLKQSYLYFSVVNSNETKIIRKGKQIVTNKKDAELHGIGIKNMISIAEKYGGHISFVFDDTTFSAKGMLKNISITD